jgi:uncharacterized protein YndB with AHSA1/START domain
MIRFAYEESITASPRDVFEVLSDITRFDEWLDMDGRLAADGPVGPGSRFQSTGHVGPFTVRGAGEVTRYEPDQAFGFRMRMPSTFDFDIDFELEPADGGTRLRGSGSMTPHRWWRLLTPLLRAEVPKGEAREARRLKTLVESAR